MFGNKRKFFILMLLSLLLPLSVHAEFSVAVYSGRQLTQNGDLHLTQGETDLTYHDVRWNDKSFKTPIYYGARCSYWFDKFPAWGVAVDFSHAKTYLAEDDTVTVTGNRNGTPVNERKRISEDIQHFNLSHGLNLVTVNGLHRWFPGGRRDLSPLGRLQLYTGLGAGLSIPHVEATINGVETSGYQIAAGPVVNGMAGVNYALTSHVSGILEYKMSYADVRADLNGGGTIHAATINHQLIFGLATNFNLW